ncbi:hypothetical protein [Thiohalocapsa halophila]|uniref:hypothetical protein n=1 Tax=Thiohalocapsa halophila TaxID=69359 RepID=UPI001906BFBE|nr:hypothetical protein [Thiohalocapsa halophila]
MLLPRYDEAYHPGQQGGEQQAADAREADHEPRDAGRGPRGWVRGLARALLRTAPQQPSPRQRRWALLREAAAQTPRPARRRHRRRVF